MLEPENNLNAQCREEVLQAMCSPELDSLLAGALPHQVIVTLCWLGNREPAQVAADLAEVNLTKALEQAEEQLELRAAASPVLGWCDGVRKNLARTVRNLVGEQDWRERRRLEPILDKPAGETRVRHYFNGDAAHSIEQWCAAIVQLVRAALVCAGDAEFQRLRDAYEEFLKGRIRATDFGRDKDRFAAVNRRTWTFARQELPRYKPARETLGEFFRYCCDLLCLDPRAFDRLMLDRYSKVEPIAKGRATSRPARDYQDISQDVWLDVWQKLPNFEPGLGSIDVMIANCRKYPIIGSVTTHPGESPASPGPSLPSTAKTDSTNEMFSELEKQPAPTLNPSEAAMMRDLHKARVEANRKFIAAVFEDCAQPHQFLAYGFVQMLDFKPSAMVQTQWRTHLESLLKDWEAGCLAQFGEVRDDDGGILVDGLTPEVVSSVVAPVRRQLKAQNACQRIFEHDGPGDKLVPLAKKNFIDYELAALRRHGIATNSMSVVVKLEEKWERMPAAEREDWCDQVRADYLSRWVNSVSKRIAVKRADARFKAEMARLAAEEGKITRGGK